MMKLSYIAKKMILFLCILMLILIAAGVVYYRSLNVLPFALGVVLAVVFNIFKVIMLDRTVRKITVMEKERASNYVRVQHLLRFFLTGAVLVLAAVIPIFNVYGAALGILTFQIALFLSKRFSNEQNLNNTNT